MNEKDLEQEYRATKAIVAAFALVVLLLAWIFEW